MAQEWMTPSSLQNISPRNLSKDIAINKQTGGQNNARVNDNQYQPFMKKCWESNMNRGTRGPPVNDDLRQPQRRR